MRAAACALIFPLVAVLLGATAHIFELCIFFFVLLLGVFFASFPTRFRLFVCCARRARTSTCSIVYAYRICALRN